MTLLLVIAEHDKYRAQERHAQYRCSCRQDRRRHSRPGCRQRRLGVAETAARIDGVTSVRLAGHRTSRNNWPKMWPHSLLRWPANTATSLPRRPPSARTSCPVSRRCSMSRRYPRSLPSRQPIPSFARSMPGMPWRPSSRQTRSRWSASAPLVSMRPQKRIYLFHVPHHIG